MAAEHVEVKMLSLTTFFTKLSAPQNVLVCFTLPACLALFFFFFCTLCVRVCVC